MCICESIVPTGRACERRQVIGRPCLEAIVELEREDTWRKNVRDANLDSIRIVADARTARASKVGRLECIRIRLGVRNQTLLLDDSSSRLV